MGAEGLEARLGNCYELSAKAVVWDEVEGDSIILVHGSIQGGGNPRITHAWVQYLDEDGDDWVYDPVMDEHRPWAMYAYSMRAKGYEAYTPDEARQYLLEHKNWGPWHTGAERPGDRTGTKVKTLVPREGE